MIGLYQVDGKLPNLALMRIASYKKRQGKEVGWWPGPLFSGYDEIFVSKIFKFSEAPEVPEHALTGGTGYDFASSLPDEMNDCDPGESWELYPRYKNHLGFSERGCRFDCAFCCVPEKDGRPSDSSSIKNLLTNPKGENRLVLLDDDFFGQKEWKDKIEEIIDRKLRVCFCQGLNIRVITDNQASYLAKTDFWNTKFSLKQVTFAWDQYKDKKLIQRGFDKCVEAGIKPYQMQFFVLIGFDTTPEQDMERIETLRGWGASPFVMAYDRTIKYQRDLQRWVNHKAIFKTVSFPEYKP